MKKVGRYEIVDHLGEGAMAEVFRARDPQIQRELAVKVLKAELSRNVEFTARFLREARAAGALSHPNIVTIYDVGECEGHPYLAMELLEGRPLDSLSHRLSIDAVIAIGLQLADALSYAHEAGVVHRDIKPSNIVLANNGSSIKILDFGIAQVNAAPTADGENLKTQVGQVIGTPRYMSPEQTMGEELDGRSDLFSVGLVLYELITGAKAFSGSNPTTLGLQIALKAPVPISELVTDCPRGLQLIINKLLAKKPGQRFATGAQLAEALRQEQVLRAGVPSSAARKRRLPLQFRVTFAVASIMAAALGAGLGTVLQRQYTAMERMAVASGDSIASFVASNAALYVVENAGRPAAEQDWLPLRAHLKSVSNDRSVERAVLTDASGIVRASTEPALVGTRYTPPKGMIVGAGRQITTRIESDSLRFVRPITYAGKTFGLLDLKVSKRELTSVAWMSAALLICLGVLMLLLVCGVSYAIAMQLLRPIEQLKAALGGISAGKANIRIAHQKSDEFADVFHAFNALAATLEERLNEQSGLALEETVHADATRIVPLKAIEGTARAVSGR